MDVGRSLATVPAERPAERIFVYGMQSSGASLLTLLIGQIPRSVVVIDLWTSYLAPPLRLSNTTVLKATVSDIPLDDHLASYQPTVTILHLRHPIDIVTSLNTKVYRDEGGTIEAKLQAMDRIFRDRGRFDLTVDYDRLLNRPDQIIANLAAIGIHLPLGAEHFPRSRLSILTATRVASRWCNSHFNDGWGLGNAHVDPVGELVAIGGHLNVPRSNDLTIWAMARDHCPDLLNYCDESHHSD